MFDLVTLSTVVIGVLALYRTLLALTCSAISARSPRVTHRGVGPQGQRRQHGQLAWLATSVATVGGALGAGLESNEAAHSYQADAELSR